MTIVSRKSLLEAGAHFGHKREQVNPKMKPYIYGLRGGVHIIDLEKTTRLLHKAYEALKQIVLDGGKVLFVGTKKQASGPIKAYAEKCGAFYVNSRWLGGTLTNHKTLRKSIDKLIALEKIETNFATKKEESLHNKRKEKLTRNFNGIRDMKALPDAVFIATLDKDHIAVSEAVKLGIPVFGLVDTNIDPDGIDYVIPANDDANRSLNLIIETMCNAVIHGSQGETTVIENSDPNKIAKENDEQIAIQVVETTLGINLDMSDQDHN